MGTGKRLVCCAPEAEGGKPPLSCKCVSLLISCLFVPFIDLKPLEKTYWSLRNLSPKH